VIPVEWARKTPKILNQLNIKHSYSEFPVGHGVAPQNFYEFRRWLEPLIQ
jgi:phospholipase/carboxylesterase